MGVNQRELRDTSGWHPPSSSPLNLGHGRWPPAVKARKAPRTIHFMSSPDCRLPSKLIAVVVSLSIIRVLVVTAVVSVSGISLIVVTVCVMVPVVAALIVAVCIVPVHGTLMIVPIHGLLVIFL